LNPQKSAIGNWTRSANLAAISRKWEVIANAPEEPTPAQFHELLAEWKKWQAP